jgi:hypothetical protein
MKKFLKITGISLLSIVVIYIILCAVAPPFAVEKSIVINAKDSVIFSKFGDFKQWDSWSPWSQKDPGIKTNSVYSGTPYTKGHQVQWVSKSEGSGRQVIEEIKPYSYIKTALYFQPNEDQPGYSEFKLTSEGTSTKVTWSMKGKMPFLMKGMFMVMGVNKMLGKIFEDGLNNLKKDCEK